MSTVNRRQLLRASAGLALAILGLPGCSENQPPEAVSDPTPLPAPANVALPTDLLDRISDKAAEYLVAELPTHPLVTRVETRRVLALGPIVNRTTSDSQRFAAAVQSLFTRLSGNGAIVRRFRIVTTRREDAADILNQVAEKAHRFEDPYGPARGEARPEPIHPDDVFVLTGQFHESASQSAEQRTFYLNVSVRHPRTREEILRQDFVRKLAWSPTTGQWEEVLR